MTKRFEVLNILVYSRENIQRIEKVGFILQDHVERKSFGCTFDEAFEMIKHEGCSNAETMVFTKEQHGYEGKKIRPLPHLNLPTFDEPSWHLPIYNSEFQPQVPYTEKLEEKINQTIKADINWNYEVKKRAWKQQNRTVYSQLYDKEMKQNYHQFATFIKESQHIVFLTGAGLGTESGIPDFRSHESIYSDPTILYKMTAEYRDQHPEGFFHFIKQLLSNMMDDILPFQHHSVLINAIELLQPNEGHRFITRLEQQGKNVTVITQNVDGLHEKAGNTNVLPLHGDISLFSCNQCKQTVSIQQALALEIPRCQNVNCLGVYQPNIILFGDDIDGYSRAKEKMVNADLLIVAGTSLQVSPANMLPDLARNARKVIVNHKPTDFDSEFDLVIHGPVSTVFGETELKLTNKQQTRKNTCDVCLKNVAEGVYASRIAPTSAAYCQSCIDVGAEPYQVVVTKVAIFKSRKNDYTIGPRLQQVLRATLEKTGQTVEKFNLDVELRVKEMLEKKKGRNGT